MLKRKIAELIEQHLASDPGRILLIDGARQVGKTYIIRYVGKKLFPNFIEMKMSNLVDTFLTRPCFMPTSKLRHYNR